jgi:hypothetical protein
MRRIVREPTRHILIVARCVMEHQVRSVFFVTLIPWAFSHALCSACALVSAAVLGRLTGYV